MNANDMRQPDGRGWVPLSGTPDHRFVRAANGEEMLLLLLPSVRISALVEMEMHAAGRGPSVEDSAFDQSPTGTGDPFAGLLGRINELVDES